MAGYSQRSLADKLGIKAGHRILVLDAPAGYAEALGPLPGGAITASAAERDLDFVHLFTTSRQDLENRLPALREAMRPNGMLWVSWPKRASGLPTDLTENVVREVALAHRLVDVKVAAVDETWSGLKLVIRLKDRPAARPASPGAGGASKRASGSRPRGPVGSAGRGTSSSRPG